MNPLPGHRPPATGHRSCRLELTVSRFSPKVQPSVPDVANNTEGHHGPGAYRQTDLAGAAAGGVGLPGRAHGRDGALGDDRIAVAAAVYRGRPRVHPAAGHV